MIDTRDGPLPGVVGQEADPPAARRRAQEGRRSSTTCTSTSARATATRRARCVRIGDVAVIAGEPVELPNGRLVSRAMDNRLGSFVALEAARLVAEAGGARVRARGRRRRAGGDHLRRRAHDRLLARARRRDRGRRDVRDRRAGHRGQGARAARVRLRARCSPAARRSTRGCSSCCTRRPRPRASRSRSRRPRARPAPTPTPSTSAAAASRRRSSRSRCATCTRRSRWCSSTTWRRARG